jgi:glycosyltransferase involved in cell wall biosynthesis
MSGADKKANKTKRHCMVVFARYPLAETRVQREAEALIKHGYEVDVISIRVRGEVAVDYYRGVRIYRVKYRFPVHLTKEGGLTYDFLNYLRFFVSAAVKLAQLHTQHPYDTVQVHNLPDFLVFSALFLKLRGVPIILDLHDLMPEFYAGRFGQEGHPWLARLIRWQERLACSFADHVITVSEHWRQALIERGVPAHKCSVVMNVADKNIFHCPEASHLRLVDQDAFRLIYHGSIFQRYGLDLAIQAVDQVRHHIPNIHLTIVGGGDYKPMLIQMAQDLGLNGHVTVSKPCLAEELPGLIRKADAGIVPYRNDVFTDGLIPTKLMEYAALGLPAIAARTSAIETYFINTMVEFFEPGDADDLARCICMLHQDQERLAELAQGCIEFNQRYNWNTIGAEYIALVKRLSS